MLQRSQAEIKLMLHDTSQGYKDDSKHMFGFWIFKGPLCQIYLNRLRQNSGDNGIIFISFFISV